MADLVPPRGRSVAGIVVNEGRFFVALRKAGGSLGRKWEFPGGKVDGNESDRDALEREYLEEFGVRVGVGPLLAGAEFENRGKRYSLNAYLVYPESLDFKLIEHTEWRWATPEEITSDGLGGGEGFADSDLRLFPALSEYISSL